MWREEILRSAFGGLRTTRSRVGLPRSPGSSPGSLAMTGRDYDTASEPGGEGRACPVSMSGMTISDQELSKERMNSKENRRISNNEL